MATNSFLDHAVGEKRATEFRLNEVACLKESHENYLKYFKERVERKVENYFEFDGPNWKHNIKRRSPSKQKKLESLKGGNFVQRLPIHTLKSDRSFLEGIPKTKFYHLVALEDEMKNEGVLKHRHEIDWFWEAANQKWKKASALSSEELKELYTITHKSLEHKQGDAAVPEIMQQSRRDLHRKLSPIREKAAKMSRPGSRAIRFPEQPAFPKLHTYKVANPKKFRSFVPKSLKTAPTYEQPAVKKIEERRPSQKRNYHERSMNHRLRCNAYQVAVVNTAMTERIMQRKYLGVNSYSVNDLLSCRVETPLFDDVSSIHENCFTTESTCEKESLRYKTQINSGLHLLPLIAGPSRPNSKRDQIDEDEVRHTENGHNEQEADKMYQPLCIDDMVLRKESFHIKEVLPSIKMWKNYAT